MPTLARTGLLAAFAAILALPAPAHAQGDRLLRQPTVSATQVAFAYANDLWVVGRSGGEARRLTSFPGTESWPHFSPDGRAIAFSGEYDGNVDVFVVPVEGGEPRRLTWHPGSDRVVGWTPDGEAVLFVSGRESAPVPYGRFFTVPVEGGFPSPVPIPRGHTGGFSADGGSFAYQPISLSDVEWRNYRGGQTRPIWVVETDDLSLTELPWDGSVDTDPVWMDGTVYFLSDRDFTTNVWAWTPASGELRQLTDHSEFDVKNLEAGGGALVYEQAGWLHLLDPSTAGSRRLDVRVRGDFPWARAHWEEVGGALTNGSLSPTGVRALFEARGDVFTVPTEEGDWRNLTGSSGAADRNPVWAPDGRSIAWFSDAEGEYALMIGSQDGLGEARRIPLENPTFYYTPAWSPDSRRILFTDADLNLWWVDVASGRTHHVDQDQFAHPERTVDPVWSPDSRWIAYSKRLDNQFHAIMVHDTEAGRTHQLTDGLSDAVSPAWDASGKYLWFLSSTDFGLNSGWLDMSSFHHPVEREIWLAVLRAEDPSPLLPESDEEEGEAAGEDEEGEDEGEEGEGEGRDRADGGGDVRVTIDFDGIRDRIVAPDLPAHSYSRLRAATPGVVFYVESEPSLEATVFSPTGVLHRYDLEEREAKEYLPEVSGYALSHDGKKLLYRAGPRWAVVPSAGQPKPGDGALSTGAIRMRVDPEAEWRQIFDEAWRIQRDYLYVENLHGADWDRVYEMYSPWVEHVRHRSDLTHLLDLLGGEVSVGHSFTGGGDEPDVERVPVGLLGADLEVADGRYRIARIYTGENWNPDLRAPLAAPGVRVGEGDYLLAVNGRELRAPENPYALFEATANRQTAITLNGRPTMDGARTVTVVPVASESGLRRLAWVEDNRRRVDEASGGRLAYVWLPNTSVAGYDYFNRYYFAQQDRQGAVVDERFNGGGYAADYMVDVMARELHGFFNNPVAERKPFTLPGAGIWGPKVMIINESAGSGGDLLPYMFRRMAIGPLVGTRTWGGLVGIWDAPPLIDGGGITAPRGGFYDLDGRWSVENEGVAPDIEVEMTPAAVAAGSDPQLETAIAEALRLLELHPVEILPEPDAPVRVRRRDPGGGR